MKSATTQALSLPFASDENNSYTKTTMHGEHVGSPYIVFIPTASIYTYGTCHKKLEFFCRFLRFAVAVIGECPRNFPQNVCEQSAECPRNVGRTLSAEGE